MLMLNLDKSAGVLDLNKLVPSLKTLRGVLNWDESPIHAKSLTEGFDLDIFVYVLDKNEKITSGNDVVYFNNKSFANGAITVPVDNRTGEGTDDEYVDLFLEKVPADKEHADVYIFIHKADERGQNFGMMANAGFVLTDVEGKNDLVHYALSNYTNETALHVGRFSRTTSGWSFNPTGDVAVADPNVVAGAYM